MANVYDDTAFFSWVVDLTKCTNDEDDEPSYEITITERHDHKAGRLTLCAMSRDDVEAMASSLLRGLAELDRVTR